MSQPDRFQAALADRYRIERELGQGGMATVYLAQDVKHDRKVALKVLKPELAAVLGAARFLTEIKTTANLQHPHILPLHDSGEVDGTVFYVMPFIDGESLRDRLNRERQLPIAEAVRIATEIASALDYAHRQGVIHRDIKPENILLHDGQALVADFGIALAASRTDGGTRMTETGMSLGTPHYMSPEQAMGDRSVDARTDIYALGCVLYEMLAGEPPFSGPTAQAIVAKVLTDEPRPLPHLRKSVPPNVAAATAQALEKLPADRFETAAAFAAALQNAAFTVAARNTGAGRIALSARPNVLVTVLAITTILFAGLAGWTVLGPERIANTAATRFTISVPAGWVMYKDETPNLAISPDGRTVVYVSNGMLYRRSLSDEAAEVIPGTEGAAGPFFSPDGQSIAFSQREEATRRVSVNGGPVTTVTDPFILGADWGQDSAIVSTTRGALWRVNASGGAPTQITTLAAGEAEHAWPQLVPDSRVLIYTVLGNTGLWDDARVVALDLGSRRRVVIREKATFGRFVPPGHVVYADADGTLSAIRFDLKRLHTNGEPFPVESGIRVGTWGGAASFAVSRSGTLAFVRGSSRTGDLVWWVDRNGKRQQLGEPTSVATLALAPNQRRIAADRFLSTLDIWLMDPVSGQRDRATFAPPGSRSYESPVWSPDSRRIATAFQRNDSMVVNTLTLDTNQEAHLFTLPHHNHLQDWSHDGNWLLVQAEHPERNGDQIAVRVDRADQRVVIAQTPAVEETGRFSPDGRWVAYMSNESSRWEVYVVSFPNTETRKQVSVDGGRYPRWSRTSGELFYWRDSTLMSVRVNTAGRFERGTPTALFAMSNADPSYSKWDVSADGQRFLIAGRNPDAPAREIHVVLNWAATLRPTIK